VESVLERNRTGVVRVVLISFALMVAASRPAKAQDREKLSPEEQQSEVRQLKDKLQKLQQTVEELKAQLARIEQARLAPADAAFAQPASPTQNTVTTPATQTTKAPTTGGNAKQENRSENTFTVYGFAMLDMGYDFGQIDPNWFDVLRTSKLPAFPDEFAPSGTVYFGVRQSRLGVKSSIDTPLGDLKTIFEFELFGVGVDAGQTTFRLRHAYGELGHFGAGQTWTAFMDPDAFPNILEYWGPPGLVWFRNVQFRWMPLKGKNAITVALERPGATGDQGVFADRIELQGIRPKFDLPDLTGNVRFNRDWGHVQISGAVRRIRWIDTTNDQFNLSGTVVGWGTALSSNLKFRKNSVGRVEVVYGKGVENYMNDSPIDVGIARSSSSDPARPITGVPLPVFGASAFLDHNWNKRFSSSIGYSVENIQNSEGQTANAFHRSHYAIANLLFYPYQSVMIGGEFQWGRRENFLDHFASNDYRIQFGFKYNFEKQFSF